MIARPRPQTRPAAGRPTLLVSLLLATAGLLAPPASGASPQLTPAPPPALPAAPPLASLKQLALSPASAALASDFFLFEQSQQQQQHQQKQLASAKLQQSNARASGSAAAPPLQLASSDSHELSLALSGANNFRLDQYHSLDEIYGYLDTLARLYKGKVRVFTLGRTAEGRPIKALELINNATDPDYVWLDALTHAREWITGSTVLYMIDQLAAGSPLAAPGVALHAKNYIVVPVVNPDGYAYTWTTNRMWRKNRSRSKDSAPESRCVGADLNRNYDLAFGGEGASPDPCSHIYAGSHPFSEAETRSIADLMWSLRDRIKFYLTIHSYNQLWSCPYAYTASTSPSLARHMRVLRAIQKAVQETEGVRYDIGPLSTSLYIGSGFGIDFAYEKCGIEHSYLVELRDKGAHGFVLPPEQIMPTARETLAGLRAGLRVVFGGR